jgi:16S rRNA (cytosine1402-N4)-methyltransferase
MAHVPVMRDEVLEALALKLDGRYLDGTFGRGGHAAAILDRLGPDGTLLVMDKDPDAIQVAAEWAERDPRVRVRQGSFAELGAWAETEAGLDGVLLDLGVSSPQLDDAARGFSFLNDGPLDMRMDPRRGISAADWLAHVGERELADALFAYGDERLSRRIARAVVKRRAEAPLTRTRELAELLERVVGFRERGKHPATRTFQALRIVVNRELEDLELGIEAATLGLKAGGRLVVLSFHSLEDRIVKHAFQGQRERAPRRGLPPLPVHAPRLRALGSARKPGSSECGANPRARSAVLRVAERLP